MEKPQSPNNWGHTIDEDPVHGILTDDEEIQKYISEQIDQEEAANNQIKDPAQQTPSFNDEVAFFDNQTTKPTHEIISDGDQVKNEIKPVDAPIANDDMEIEDTLNGLPSKEKIVRPTRFYTEKKIGAMAHRISERDTDINRRARRLFKESNKYNNNYTNPEKQEAAEQKANLPFFEDNQDIQTEVRLDTKENFDKVLSNASERLGRHLDEYYIEGAMDDLAHGGLNINPRGFVMDGFRRTESLDIEQNLVDDQKEAFWHDIKTEVIPEQIGDWESDIDNLKEAEQEALSRALKRGAFKEQTSLDKKAEVRLALPIFEHRNGQLENFMREYGLDPESQFVQMDSHEGFIGIIEAIKDNDEISKGFRALDWYFDTFRYEEHLEEFFDTMDAYQAQSDRAFRRTFRDYMDYREEVIEWEKQQDKQDKEDIASLAESEEISQEELFKFLEDNLAPEPGQEEIFNIEDINRAKNKHVKRKKANIPPKEEKCRKALEEIKEIVKRDPNASYYRGTIFREDSFGNSKEFPYVVVRFGDQALGLNNVIAIPVCDESKAMFYWRGETGDDKDGWKPYFKNTSIRGRDSSVKACRCYDYTNKGYLALDAQWERVWRYLTAPKKEESEQKSA